MAGIPGIVPLLHTYLDANPPCLEYEYVEGGDLTGLIREWHARRAADGRLGELAVAALAEIVAAAHRPTRPSFTTT